MNTSFEGSNRLGILTLVILIYSLIAIFIFQMPAIPTDAFLFMAGWIFLSVVFCLISFKEFVSGFLLSTFCMLIGWRIAAIYNITAVTCPLILALMCVIANYIYTAYLNIKNPEKYLHQLTIAEWQLIFVRLYIGFNLVPHFTEKLFAGAEPHLADVQAFMQLGVPNPDLFVWLAGLCEFASAIALGLGFIMRLGALGAAIYLFIATYLGHHFSYGFIWAGPGGGWEFATMWMVLILSFAWTGSHHFTIDQRLEDSFKNILQTIKKIL